MDLHESKCYIGLSVQIDYVQSSFTFIYHLYAEYLLDLILSIQLGYQVIG